MPKKSRRHSPEGATISRYSGSTGEDQRKGQGRHNPKSNSTPTNNNNNNKMASMDLKVVDDAFGKTSDLYEDVLQVSSASTQEEIQLAYFDRRSELFTLLAKIDSKPQSESMVNQRFKAEQKMDSVVLAVRILGDPGSRASYDGQVRPYRTKKSKSQQHHHHHQQQQQQQQKRQQQPRQAAAITAMTTPERDSKRSFPTARQQEGGGAAAAVVTPRSITMENNVQHDMEQTTIELQPSFASNTSSSVNRKKTSRGLASSGKVSSERSAKKKRHDPSSPSKDSSNSWFPFSSSHFNTGTGSFRKNKRDNTKNPSSKNVIVKSNDAAGVSVIVEGPTPTTTTSSSDVGKKSSPSIAAAVLSASSSSGKSKGNSKTLSSLETFESATSDAEVSSAVAESMTMESRQGDEEIQTQADTVETMSTFDLDYEDDEDEDVDAEELLRGGGKNSGKGKRKSSTKSTTEDGMFSCISASKYLKTVSDEISGACEDTLISVDQVFNAFTLTDKDIKAVTKKIDKAKRQLDT
eukprot:CAMPEP_0113483840 /NCGR_PEP_ID=MMETSP0014_2-20120614/23645_1 /TAXON_ID=2857 /ORGANISM="Nitzschia sp." /LENGTH=520 /DNA_ID=CAMNT_0000377407 /DNA_START=559 /DNA_END=2121 /DNA_ORIENTATION=+ /assembly_acc=CAM_ASM_000159